MITDITLRPFDGSFFSPRASEGVISMWEQIAATLPPAKEFLDQRKIKDIYARFGLKRATAARSGHEVFVPAEHVSIFGQVDMAKLPQRTTQVTFGLNHAQGELYITRYYSINSDGVEMTTHLSGCDINGRDREELERALLETVGSTAQKVVVPWPNPVIKLPIPPWVELVGYDLENCWHAASYVMEEEFNEAVREYREQLIR